MVQSNRFVAFGHHTSFFMRKSLASTAKAIVERTQFWAIRVEDLGTTDTLRRRSVDVSCHSIYVQLPNTL